MGTIMIPFTKPSINYIESVKNIIEVLYSYDLSGSGEFTKECNKVLEAITGSEKVLITHSGTDALEMCALLSSVGLDDEVIMPSFTFVSTANAFVLKGARPVFVDVREDTLNIDETKIEEVITNKTRAIVPVHYAGISCEMDKIQTIANKHNLLVIEDAAQCIHSYHNNSHLGAIGDLGILSFHGTKNLAIGEGGALLVNNQKFIERSEVIWEKGTNRGDFSKKRVDKYSWVDLGSSYTPNEITAALLLAQLQTASKTIDRRKLLWSKYYSELRKYEDRGVIQLLPEKYYYENHHNAHIFWFLIFDKVYRNYTIQKLKESGIEATSHFVPLHTSPFGKRYYRHLPVTEDISERLIRLPLYNDMELEDIDYVLTKLKSLLE
jgi:dTDP-4-amino-4,6-dideoxygalactose transaminase